MKARAATPKARDVLSFRRGVHRFAIDASAVSFVHDGPTVDAAVPRIDLRQLFGDGLRDDGLHELRVTVNGEPFDLRAGTQLRVVRIETDAFVPIPSWLEPFASRAALDAVCMADDSPLWHLDLAALAKRASRVETGGR